MYSLMNIIAWKTYNLTTVNLCILGGTQIRTEGREFAIHCLTAWPYRLYYTMEYTP